MKKLHGLRADLIGIDPKTFAVKQARVLKIPWERNPRQGSMSLTLQL
jgi:hypothetical protein